ncbi:MAG TPA: hypothetical protein VM029_05340 [Opitutaceae bacterium]|nr:hypothetical protein [Opitutaceae bacterium]
MLAAETAMPARIPAFPGATGAGMHATGGRGGTVVHVTNLNASGPGSLADAVSGPDRIVVFDVSGIIDLARDGMGGRIVLAHPNVTIAGQTAPGEGICLRGGALQIQSPNIIVRHLRSRRGFISDGEMGDAIAVKPRPTGDLKELGGRTAEVLEAIRIKKLERGRPMSEFEDIDDILIDHCSASWATDENLTMTHAGRATVSFCIAAEGLDYANPNQTPPNHSEGGLWGSAAPDGRSTMHHVLFAHNRLRNPRTTAGAEIPPVLTLYNSVVYNWSEYATHTGSQKVFIQWLGNYYVPGPDTSAETRGTGFQFHGHPDARVFAQGNAFDGTPAATANNRLAVGHNNKFKKASATDKAAMIVDRPWTELPALQTADQALATVLAEAGATLPARDAVDRRIVESVRRRAGRVIGKETDLPEADRWPDYRSLPAPLDSDRDGLPDFWETQFGLDPRNAADGAAPGAGGYVNIEHYLNNTDPRAPATRGPREVKPVVMIAATVSRANAGAREAGEWRVSRVGDMARPLTVAYQVSGDARAGSDFAALSGSVTIPAGAASAPIALTPLGSAADNRTAVVTLAPGRADYYVGCPAQSLVVIRR